MVIKSIEHNDFQITVEEKDDKFIATFWNKCHETKSFRIVEEFETFGGAMGCAFDYLKDVFFEYESIKELRSEFLK
jgi:hypothetical protein